MDYKPNDRYSGKKEALKKKPSYSNLTTKNNICEHGTNHIGFLIYNTYRSAEPVSKSSINVCPPITTGAKYDESYLVGSAETMPSLAAAAATMSSGAGLSNLMYVDSNADGPDFNGWGTASSIVKNCLISRRSTGEANEIADKNKPALNFLMNCMVKDSRKLCS